MRKKLTLQEWQEIGSKAKNARKALMDLADALRVLPKTVYLDKWLASEKAFGKLRSHLDDIVCSELTSEQDRVVINIFYGDKE